ncbi:MAG: succinate dehydrogenase/fumarate reductase flavoprotein subunit, partial [Syntrophaceae bacterium]|nr:succinate dehydrogenase/fumarate reductase flavoprotein subunit [Syntrophaceae bacterium]
CLVYGGITGEEIVKYLRSEPELRNLPMDQVDQEINRLYVDYLQKNGKENFYAIKDELRALMDQHAGVFRTGKSLKEGLDKIMVLKERFKGIYVTDKNYVYNTNLMNALETENLLDLAEVLVTAGLAREESRGAHARTDFPVRDDDNWLKHTLASYSESGPKLDYKPVVITKWKPVERTY